MSTKQRRSVTTAAQKITVPTERKRKTRRPAKRRTGNGHWTVRVTRNQPALIAEMLRPCHLIIQNHGPATIKLVANDGDLMDLPPGALRATYASGLVRIEVCGTQSALIELEFQPVFVK
jgi:hypothetical protein